MTLDQFNSLSVEEAREQLTRCCGCGRWVNEMARRRPYWTREKLFDDARKVWGQLQEEDWREAFEHHPRIGDIDALRRKFASTANWAEGEQAGAAAASEEVLAELQRGNDEYEKRFGHIFIVCATGKSAAEMLALLKQRIDNQPNVEMKNAAGEQEKITKLRLEKMLSEAAQG